MIGLVATRAAVAKLHRQHFMHGIESFILVAICHPHRAYAYCFILGVRDVGDQLAKAAAPHRAYRDVLGDHGSPPPPVILLPLMLSPHHGLHDRPHGLLVALYFRQ